MPPRQRFDLGEILRAYATEIESLGVAPRSLAKRDNLVMRMRRQADAYVRNGDTGAHLFDRNLTPSRRVLRREDEPTVESVFGLASAT